MQFKGVETETGDIVLKAQHAPGCLARIEAAAVYWLERGLWLGVGAVLGLVLGWVAGS
jgi:hypothetical protein